jgi:hypothetical protein
MKTPMVRWLSTEEPLHVSNSSYSDLLVTTAGDVALRDWRGFDHSLIRKDAFFTNSNYRICALTSESTDGLLLMGEEGQIVIYVDADHCSWTWMAELPRFEDRTGGMRHLHTQPVRGAVVVLWELGVLVIDHELKLRWRHDLEWNHSLAYIDDSQVWFNLMYDSEENVQRVEERPWGFSILDGHELFDTNMPS